jgi:hypothetical protein
MQKYVINVLETQMKRHYSGKFPSTPNLLESGLLKILLSQLPASLIPLMPLELFLSKIDGNLGLSRQPDHGIHIVPISREECTSEGILGDTTAVFGVEDRAGWVYVGVVNSHSKDIYHQYPNKNERGKRRLRGKYLLF